MILRPPSASRTDTPYPSTTPFRSPPPMLTADGSAVEPTSLRRLDGMLGLAYDFTLPLARDVGYRFDGEDYRVDCALEGDLRIAYVSCNGQESGDRKRSLDERDRKSTRLNSSH